MTADVSILDVGDKFSSIGGFLLALIIALITLARYIRRERSNVTSQSAAPRSLLWAVFVAASLLILGLLILAILADPDFAFIAIYLTLAFVLGDILGQAVREWAYSGDVDEPMRRLRAVDRASTGAWVGLVVLVEIGLTVISAQYASGSQLFFQVLLAFACTLSAYYPYHFELRSDYRARMQDNRSATNGDL